MRQVSPKDPSNSGAGPAEEVERLRLARAQVSAAAIPGYAPGNRPAVNPTVVLLPLAWKNLIPMLGGSTAAGAAPEPGSEMALLWKGPHDEVVRARAAAEDDLLALKLVVEEIEPAAAAAAGSVTLAEVEEVLRRGEDAGILLRPRSRIRRPVAFPRGEIADETFLESTRFTLQWHLTQACDLHCKHCYDRSSRLHLPLDDCRRIIDDLRDFCRQRNVRGAISFSGGNPLMHPDFLEVYRAAADRGFTLSILGNPAPRERIEEIAAIRRPYLFQVSLEGLPEQNDRVRGPGHFARTERFLEVLKECGISSMVMLTLTADNIDQVLPLAERLRGRVDDFHFNRLAMVGEGANLRLPGREEYARFLVAYLAAAEKNPALGIKDNLINIILRERGAAPFGGCTGFGCGAAFNFLALLPDGEAHACRKFPSPVGNLFRDGIASVYDSPGAERYRAGCAACSECRIRPVCGGCLAVAHGFGLEVFRERDPLCFLPGH